MPRGVWGGGGGKGGQGLGTTDLCHPIPMLHTKFRGNRPSGSREEDV